jgi:hypothetical protein
VRYVDTAALHLQASGDEELAKLVQEVELEEGFRCVSAALDTAP